jgi:hypothetical protein
MTTNPGAHRLRSWVIVSIAASGLFALVAACGSGFLHGIGGGAPDAQPDAADAALCYELVPERPQKGESATDIDLLFALEDIRLDTTSKDGGLPPAAGLDLDRTCTCPAAPSCIGSDTGPPACDGDGGRDNAFSSVFNEIETFLASADFGAYIRAGGFTALIDVQQWNGEDDDPLVVVAIRMSQGLESNVVDGGANAAKFDGTDVWTVDPGSIFDGKNKLGADCASAAPTPCVPVYVDPRAYVANGKLIAHLDVPIGLSTPSGRLIFDMTNVTLIAAIAKVGGSYRLEGEVVGRSPVERLLPNIAALRDPSSHKSLCGGAAYALLKARICGAVDIMSDPRRDGTNAACDAVSGAIRFVASPARAGRVFETDDARSDCPGFEDSCSK